MKHLSKVALGAVVAMLIVGCGEEAEFADREYTHDYLKDDSNAKVLVKLVEFCEANKNAKLSTIQMKNCEMGNFIKRKKNQSFSILTGVEKPTEWDELVKKYGKNSK